MENQEINNDFAFDKQNYKLIVFGIATMVIGYFLMIGGGSEDPNEFSYELFSVTRIYVAPLLILVGLGVVGWGIMKKVK